MLVTTFFIYLIYIIEVLASALSIWSIILLYLFGIVLAIDVYIEAK